MVKQTNAYCVQTFFDNAGLCFNVLHVGFYVFHHTGDVARYTQVVGVCFNSRMYTYLKRKMILPKNYNIFHPLSKSMFEMKY